MSRRSEFAEQFPGAIILPYENVWPEIHESAFVAPGAVVIGNVTIGKDVSIWFNSTVRGDIASITIGDGSNVQDGSLVHVNADAPVVIGKRATIGHLAIIHGTTIGDDVLVGMSATVMSYTTIGHRSIIAAGALITERTIVPPGSVMVGMPAKPREPLDEAQQEHLTGIAGRYIGVKAKYRTALRALREDEAHEY